MFAGDDDKLRLMWTCKQDSCEDQVHTPSIPVGPDDTRDSCGEAGQLVTGVDLHGPVGGADHYTGAGTNLLDSLMPASGPPKCHSQGFIRHMPCKCHTCLI
ncbi:hypothetical protein H920_06924 [Fukomys damarensis]|uniref:Uncharacterized protein n=1 Tax=Fukomys damarensis TaxID=885580 RepID=A0A091DNA6_FUKDA|nr:hypothetical protein H920_06924 [Fukomys damarensis]